jgi:sugar phosphate isomerase/epimerase
MKVANAVKTEVFCELGLGAIDFRAIMAKLKKQNYIGWTVVEQDVLPGMGVAFRKRHPQSQHICRSWDCESEQDES